MADPRRPEYDSASDPLRPVRPGGIERDIAAPGERIDPYNDPRIAGPRRGIVGATLAVAAVLIAVLAFALFGGTSTDQASVPPPERAIEGTGNPPTGSIAPDEAPAVEPAPARPAQ